MKEKMSYYKLSEQRVKRVMRNPERTEEGIAPGTTAVMQRNDTKKGKQEIWVMFQTLRPQEGEQSSFQTRQDLVGLVYKKRIISAWRYPGVSPKGKPIEIPDDTLEEIMRISTEQEKG